MSSRRKCVFSMGEAGWATTATAFTLTIHNGWLLTILHERLGLRLWRAEHHRHADGMWRPRLISSVGAAHVGDQKGAADPQPSS